MSILKNSNLVFCTEYILYRNYSELKFNADTDTKTAESVYVNVKKFLPEEYSELRIESDDDRIMLNCFNSTVFNEAYFQKYRNSKFFIHNNILIILNTNEHIEIRCINYNSNDEYSDILKLINDVSKQIEGDFTYAFENEKYYNSFNLNCGTGLLINSYIHLPILSLMNMLNDKLESENFYLSKIDNIDSNPICAFVKFSNVRTTYKDIETQINEYYEVLNNLTDSEIYEQNKIMNNNPDFILDKINKSYGLLKYSYLIDDYEFLTLLTFFRLSSEINIISISVTDIDRIFRSIFESVIKNNDKEYSNRQKSILLKEKLLNVLKTCVEGGTF